MHCLSRHNKYGFVYTYNDNVNIPYDAPNNPHDDYEAINDENDSDYVDTESMHRIDNVDDPLNTDDSFYSEPIEGVEDHKEETYHKEITDGHHEVNPQETQQQYPP